MGSKGFEPLSWDFSCLSTPIDHHTVRLRVFLQRQLESQMIARLHYNPIGLYNYNILFINHILNSMFYYLNLIFYYFKPRERFELPCNGSAVHRFASKLPWRIQNFCLISYLNFLIFKMKIHKNLIKNLNNSSICPIQLKV